MKVVIIVGIMLVTGGTFSLPLSSSSETKATGSPAISSALKSSEENSTEANVQPFHPLVDFNATQTATQQLWDKLNEIKAFVQRPYIHQVVVPVLLGVTGALVTLILICSIRSCAKSHARQRRKRRIRNLADELKTDRTMLLADSSDEEF